jgi:hypothetical protein
MRPILLIVGAVLVAFGLFFAIGTAVAVASCEAQYAPCSESCPDVFISCPAWPEFLGIGLAIIGAALLTFGVLTRSADQITAEVIANLRR